MSMTNDPDRLVTEIVHAAGGRVVGRIRFQKIVYLLEQLGMKGGFRFSYHHFGPYSRHLTHVLDFSDGVTEEEIRLGGGFTSVFKMREPQADSPSAIGALDWDQAKKAVEAMTAETSVVIELAATIHWLRHKEQVADWRSELKIRKASKASDERIDAALGLLDSLELAD